MYIGDRQSMQNEIKNKIETKESEEKCVFLVNKYFLINIHPPVLKRNVNIIPTNKNYRCYLGMKLIHYKH